MSYLYLHSLTLHMWAGVFICTYTICIYYVLQPCLLHASLAVWTHPNCSHLGFRWARTMMIAHSIQGVPPSSLPECNRWGRQGEQESQWRKKTPLHIESDGQGCIIEGRQCGCGWQWFTGGGLFFGIVGFISEVLMLLVTPCKWVMCHSTLSCHRGDMVIMDRALHHTKYGAI